MKMRAPCTRCGSEDGKVENRSGQDCVFCARCARYAYNAPRVETGRATRSLRTRPDIRPSQRARVLVRDNGTCVLCHHADYPVDIGHLLSVHDGRRLGMSDIDLYDDENLAVMCQACNSGLSAQTVPLTLMLNVLRARLSLIRLTRSVRQVEEGETA